MSVALDGRHGNKKASKARHLSADEIYRKRLAGELQPPDRAYRVMDLFCGAGGMTLGFCAGNTVTRPADDVAPHHVHFKSVWANDFNGPAIQTYNANFGTHATHGPIEEQLGKLGEELPKADIVVGGPPCQGFSLLNKGRRTDGRKAMWQHYMAAVKQSGASVFVMENVPQLLTSDEYLNIEIEADRQGFKVHKALLLAADYGVPQTRRRAIVIGCKFADPNTVFPPTKTHYDARNDGTPGADHMPGARTWVPVSEALTNLEHPVGTSIRVDDGQPNDLHFGRNPTQKSIERYKVIPAGGNRTDLLQNRPDLTPKCWVNKKGGTDLFGRLWADRPSVTIRTEFFKPEKGRYLHPTENRPITHREAARFQSFPDWFKFKGSKIEIARQIGNAVPPTLAARIADVVLELLLSQEQSHSG